MKPEFRPTERAQKYQKLKCPHSGKPCKSERESTLMVRCPCGVVIKPVFNGSAYYPMYRIPPHYDQRRL